MLIKAAQLLLSASMEFPFLERKKNCSQNTHSLANFRHTIFNFKGPFRGILTFTSFASFTLSTLSISHLSLCNFSNDTKRNGLKIELNGIVGRST